VTEYARAAATLLEHCRTGGGYPVHLLQALAEAAWQGEDGAAQALFRGLVEPLCDAFEPELCDQYALLFSAVIAQLLPHWSERELRSRYQRVRRPARVERDYDRVLVLSRVTLGADVAVTSVVLDAVKKRFPSARVGFVGPGKSWELFDRDPRLDHVEAPYSRTGTLRGRLEAGIELRGMLSSSGALVVDPDSRLTQLGLIPVCPEQDYVYFESRAFGGAGHESLTELAARWAAQTFGVEGARPYVAPSAAPAVDEPGLTSMSLGVGENPAKRIHGAFEEQLTGYLLGRGHRLLIDQGAGGEETERVRRLLDLFPGQIRTWSGAFAPFAASIARSSLYVGYDSAGQHVAAACGTPLVTVFAGHPSRRMLERWTPYGAGRRTLVAAEETDWRRVLERAIHAIDQST